MTFNFGNPFMTEVTEMIAITEAYIHVRTGEQVRISPHYLDIQKLTEAYNYARSWFEEHNAQFILIR